MSPPSQNLNGQIHSHRLFLPQSAAAVLFGALGARGAPVAIGGGACGRCLGLVSARELAGTVNEGEESSSGPVDLVAVSIEGPADATAAAAAEMLSVARRAAEEAAGIGSSSSDNPEVAASGGMWSYCDETGKRRGPFAWPQVLRWARRGFWQPGFPLRDLASGGILPSALAVAAMAFLFPAVDAASAQAQAAAAAAQQQQRQQQQQMTATHQQQQQYLQQHHHQQQQQQQQQPTAMATEAPPLAVPAQPRPSPVIHHHFAAAAAAAAAAPEEEMMTAAPSQQQQQQQKQHPQQPGKSRMNIADALSILGRSGVGGGGGRRRGAGGGGAGGGGQQASTLSAAVPAAAYAPAVAAYRPPAAAAGAPASSTSSSSAAADPRALAQALDAAVVSSLAPAVALRLRAVHGDLWLDALPREHPLPWRDPEAVLAVLRATWMSSFRGGYGGASTAEARAAAAVESLPRSLRAARAGRGPAVSEAACALADLVRDFPGGGGGKGGVSSEEAAAAAAALARARAAAAAAASKAASAGWI